MRPILFRIGRAVLAGYAGSLLLVAGCQNQILYQPRRGSEARFIAAARQQNLQPWRDAQGRLIGWVRPNPRATHRLVVFHGNAGCALDRSYYADAFAGFGNGADWEVRIFEYPGYGPRPGPLGKSAFINEGRAALQELLAADPRPIFLLGESIGSGTACALAADSSRMRPSCSCPAATARCFSCCCARAASRSRCNARQRWRFGATMAATWA